MTETKKTSAGRKVRKILLSVLCGVLVFFLLLILGMRAYFRLPVRDYYRNSEKSFVIPGLSDGMIVQGLAYDKGADAFFVTGYRSDGQASQLSVVAREDGREIKRLWLADVDGKAHTGHVGGVAVNGDYIYVADSRGLFVYSRLQVGFAENGETVRALGVFSTATDEDSLHVAFVHVQEDMIYVGEFYREQNYPTPDSHKVRTAAGDDNPALILAYRLDDAYRFGIAPRIERAYSAPALVQGMCFDAEGRMYLSTSYAVAFSHIYRYDAPKAEGGITVLGQTVPLYVLDSSTLSRDIKLAPMAEEIVVVDGKLYTMCESATGKYIFGKFTSASHCYATDLSAYD